MPFYYRSQGIAIIWDTKTVEIEKSVVGEFSISIRIKPREVEEWWLVGIYGLCKKRERNLF